MNVEQANDLLLKQLAFLFYKYVGHLVLTRNQRLLISGCLADDGGNYAWIINPNDRMAHKSVNNITQMHKKLIVGFGDMLKFYLQEPTY